MSNKKAITLTTGFVVNQDIMSEDAWSELESGLNSREIDITELVTRLGMSEEALQSNLTQ